VSTPSNRSRAINRAADFIWRNARLLERALFAHAFFEGPAEAVRAAVAAYRNPDGGFGHALEPDVRAPESMPLHCEIALRALRDAGIRDAALATGVAEYLGSIAEPDGPVPLVTRKILDYPRAAHWNDPQPTGDSPNPIAALAGLLLYQGITHPWLTRATAWCGQRLDHPIGEAHEILAALTFLDYAPDRPRARELAIQFARNAEHARWFILKPGSSDYGLTPLHLCPRPDAIARPAFPDDLLNAHLDDLAARQQDDGGWPIAWTAPSAAAEMEWRGRWTLEALACLRGWDRI
jgi:hypothetical protein